MMMSRIGKAPISIPAGVEITIANDNVVTVKGSRGSLTQQFRSEILIEVVGTEINVSPKGSTRLHQSLHGLTRTLVANMVEGVSKGFEKNLELVGVGYKAQVQGQLLVLQLGYSHPVEVEIPAGMEVKVDANTKVSIKGNSKQAVGDLAAFVRSKRPPEPYKGKGVKYAGEVIIRKAGKSGKK
jgi:large subunit ribosomal protein L6